MKYSQQKQNINKNQVEIVEMRNKVTKKSFLFNGWVNSKTEGVEKSVKQMTEQ